MKVPFQFHSELPRTPFRHFLLGITPFLKSIHLIHRETWTIFSQLGSYSLARCRQPILHMQKCVILEAGTGRRRGQCTSTVATGRCRCSPARIHHSTATVTGQCSCSSTPMLLLVVVVVLMRRRHWRVVI